MAAIVLTATLGACATGQSQQQSESRSVGASAGGASMAGADMRAMCADMQQKMMSAKTPEERKAMMQEHMKSMPPEMRQQMPEHMEMMCR